MIKEKDRIRICQENYGLTEEEATRIVKSDNCLLSLEELRMKFDYPDLGKKYPDWLSPIDHYKMCCATVRQMYNSNFERICSPDEMASILYIKSSIKLNTIKSYKHLKTALVTMSMGICRDGMRRQKYWSNKSLDDTVVEDKVPMYETIVAKDNEQEEQECLNAVMSIKNREVRELLIIAGFIIIFAAYLLGFLYKPLFTDDIREYVPYTNTCIESGMFALAILNMIIGKDNLFQIIQMDM